MTAMTGAGSTAGTRERLVEAALNAFSRTGFDGTSNRDIERLAGVERGLLNYHFGSKQALWDEAVDALFERYFNELEVLQDALRDVSRSQRARALIMAYGRFSARNPELFRILILEGHSEGPRSDRLAALLKRAMAVFTDLSDTMTDISVDTGIRMFQILGASGSLYSLPHFGELTFGAAMHEAAFIDRFATSLASIALGDLEPSEDGDAAGQVPVRFLGE